jgi:iron complex transport system ATP-binding protein
MSKSLMLSNLTVARGSKTLCSNLSLTITPGDYWAVLGPNGSGKTTLLHTLAGQLTPAGGQIFLNGQHLSSLSARCIAKEIGILFQDSPFIFPQSVHEYCLAARFPHHSLMTAAQPLQADLALAHQALAALELTALAAKNIQHLSGGEQRRAAIAALLVQAPSFYLLDEPANHLDLHHQIQTMNLFDTLTSKHAVIMSLHDINLAERYCNKILMLFPDGTTEHGTRQHMLNRENLSRLYQHPIDAIRNGDQTYWLPLRSHTT